MFVAVAGEVIASAANIMGLANEAMHVRTIMVVLLFNANDVCSTSMPAATSPLKRTRADSNALAPFNLLGTFSSSLARPSSAERDVLQHRAYLHVHIPSGRRVAVCCTRVKGGNFRGSCWRCWPRPPVRILALKLSTIH